jgi:hypothetical protein
MTARLRFAAVGVGLGVLMAAGVWTTLSAQGNRPTYAAIVLTETGTGCGKTIIGNDTDQTKKDRIWARRGRAIQWKVLNYCNADATIALGGWTLSGVANDPGAGKRDCIVASGGECLLNMAIKGNADLGTYSYTVSINGTVYDPDVIIEN